MKRNVTLFLGVFIMLMLASQCFAQGDNDPNPNVNLGCLPDAIVTGSIPADSGRGLPTDILWNPETGAFQTESSWHEYGLGWQEVKGGVTKEDPVYWMVEWPTEKNINYISANGVFGNQPQPNTGWAVQVWADSISKFVDLPKADNGWADDSLRGISGWINDGLLQWRGVTPISTKKLRFIVFANPDSLADEVESFADSVWSYTWTGRSDGDVKSTLIQYLDYTDAGADNEMDEMVNLGLIGEAVVSASFKAGEIDNVRGAPTELLFDPVKGDFHYTGTPWGEFGFPWQYDAGYLEYENPFYWMVEWAVPKNVNYFTWGGVYGNQPQPTTPWAVEYWDGEWITLVDGVGGAFVDGDTLYPYTPGVDTEAKSIWLSDTPIQTTKFRFAVWSDGIDPLFSYHMRGRGGSTQNWDETEDVEFKAIMLQYKDLNATSIESNDDVEVPTKFDLHQNYPNPFNPTTKIGYSLETQGHVRLAIYNVLGQEVDVLVDEIKPGGLHNVKFDASKLSSGLYFYRLQFNQNILTKKMLLLQ